MGNVNNIYLFILFEQGMQREKNEQQKALEKLIRDSRQLGKSPEISAALQAVETRWDGVSDGLDAQTAELKKAADAWAAYENLSGQVDKTLDLREKSIANLPAATFVETSQLEAQLRLTKSLHDDVKADKKLIDGLNDSCQNVLPFVSAPLVAELNKRPQTVIDRWQKLVGATGQKVEQLGDDLTERRAFWEDWKNLETWVKDASWKVGTTQELYTDNMDKTKRDLEVGHLCLFLPV